MQRRSERISFARLILFVFGFLISVVLFLTSGPLAVALAAPFWLLPFTYTVVFHRRIDAALTRHIVYRAIKERHLAAMALDWSRLPTSYSGSRSETHPFARDLDLIGTYSLHRLIDTTVTEEASQRLAEWLLTTNPEPARVMERQVLVQELVPLARLRDRLHLTVQLGTSADLEHSPGRTLHKWLETPTEIPAPGVLAVLAFLGLVSLGLLIADAAGLLPPLWLGSLFLYFGIYFGLGRQASGVFHRSLALRDAFEQVSGIFALIGSLDYANKPRVSALTAGFRDSVTSPAYYLKRLGRLATAAGVTQNPLIWFLLNLFFPWDLAISYRLEKLRRSLRTLLPVWLDVWYELSSAAALATFHYLNPQYAVPQLTTTPAGPLLSGKQLGHPLIPDSEKVCNDFALPGLGSIALITGSNMSGKSSFLRTLGLNLALAYAGGPVDAACLRTSYFRPFSSIRLTDSVTDGISYFYAEVKRLKWLLLEIEKQGEWPVFFLIDEIFRGTNNRERLIGSRSFIEALLSSNALGIVATHDLELVRLADEHSSVANYHFRDAVVGDHMTFDYTLHQGPSPTTNALKIMRLEGLPVDEAAGDKEWRFST